MIEHELEVALAPVPEQPTFQEFANELVAEHQRLVELAAQHANSVEARERSLRESEQSLSAQSQQLGDERQNLERWRDELQSQATELDQLRQRLADVEEREAALATIGREFAERFGSS